MKRLRFLLAVVVLVSAPQAWAQAAKPAATPQARPAADPAAEAFKAWDRDRDGTLSPAEFRTGWLQAQRIADTQARLRHQFGVVDANGSGAIDPAEYGSLVLVRQAGKSAPPMTAFDANRDGKLAFGEYVKLVQALAPQDTGRDAAK